MSLRSTRARRGRRGAFTLMEVLLALAILVIVGSLAVVSIVRMQSSGYERAAKTQINAFVQAALAYQLDVGQLPNQLQDLRSPPADLPNPRKWKGPYLTKDIEPDPWGVEYRYQAGDVSAQVAEDQLVRITSAGPDRQHDTDDDITN